MDGVRLFTSESVSEGHPDKLADQISDALLDRFLAGDPQSRTGIETVLGKGFVVVTGEVKTETYVEIPDVVRDTIESVGYNDISYGFDGRTCGVLVSIHNQSIEIAEAVDDGGAGDQGMMFGYACTETEELMPLPIAMAHAMMRRQAWVKREHPGLGILPDAKCQVTITYEGSKPKAVHTIVCSCQHSPKLTNEEVEQRVKEHIIEPTLRDFADRVDIEGKIQYHINPSGKFTIGGPEADAGLTGRKVIVDTYGGFAPHGGGAFSGKDPTKVDRSATYMCRHVAKCIVAAGLAERALVSVAYAIGMVDPVQISVETFGTNQVDEKKIEALVRERFSFKPREIERYLQLRSGKFLYRDTARNGHFGAKPFPWEDTSAAKDLVV